MSETVGRALCSLRFEDRQRREGFGDWLVGEAFAFDKGASRRAVYLGSGDGASLGSDSNPVEIVQKPVDLPRLEAVFTDKSLYREGDDTVRIVALCPKKGGQDVVLRIDLNGQELAQTEVTLDDNGMGIFELPDPIAGQYEVHLGDSTASFVSAAYKLAPLTARFESFELREADFSQSLAFVASLESFGTPFSGKISAAITDLGQNPPSVHKAKTLEARDGRLKGELALNGEGPFAIQLQAQQDAMKTATLPVPGTRQEERSATELSFWGPRQIARLVPFAGSELRRGVYVAEDGGVSKAPIKLVETRDGKAVLKLRAEADAWCVVAINPEDGAQQELSGGQTEAGELIEVPLSGPWTLILAGVSAMGSPWEGRAAVIAPSEEGLTVGAPETCEPGDEIEIAIEGPAGSSAFVLVKDARLQVADTPMAATAAGVQRQIKHGLGLFKDGPIARTLDDIIPKFVPSIPFAGVQRGGRGVVLGAIRMRRAPAPQAMAMPEMTMAAPGSAPMPPPAMPAPKGEAFFESDDMPMAFDSFSEGADDPRSTSQDASQEKAPREDFPEVVLARLVRLDPTGRAIIPVTLGDAMGTMAVEVFAVSGNDWMAAQRTLQVTREAFGELVLPKFVRKGDFAEGALYVSVNEGSAEVEITRGGNAIALHCGDQTGTALTLAAPGGTVRFVAEPGEYAAMVRGQTVVDRSSGKVEEPGKLIWLQKAVKLLSPGDSVSADDPGVLGLSVLPSLDGVFDNMVGGLRSYAHCCCEQTSAVMLAAAAAYMTAKDDGTRRSASNHIRACVERERSMHLPGRGFKGWPEMPDEVFCYSPGATLNLLQMEMLLDADLDRDLARAIDDCLDMARDAARAHSIEVAPEQPGSAREAYGRFGKFVADRQRMAAFIRERIEPWDKEMQAILKFDLPSLTTETYHRSPAMIRSETAYGAATLIELGGEHLMKGLELANTVLGAIGESGSLYSTLDSVAAITLMTALRRSKFTAGGNAPVEINGALTSAQEAIDRTDIQTIKAVDSPVQVEVRRVVEEDYTAINQGVDAEVWVQKAGRKITGPIGPGDAVELVIDVKNGYEGGDLVHVFLPDALSWVHGGGQVKRFSIDTQGQTRLTIPLAATGLTLGQDGGVAPQHFAVCVRNMYDEDRGKGFGDLAITVAEGAGGAQEPSGLANRVWKGLKSLF